MLPPLPGRAVPVPGRPPTAARPRPVGTRAAVREHGTTPSRRRAGGPAWHGPGSGPPVGARDRITPRAPGATGTAVTRPLPGAPWSATANRQSSAISVVTGVPSSTVRLTVQSGRGGLHRAREDRAGAVGALPVREGDVEGDPQIGHAVALLVADLVAAHLDGEPGGLGVPAVATSTSAAEQPRWRRAAVRRGEGLTPSVPNRTVPPRGLVAMNWPVLVRSTTTERLDASLMRRQ